MDTQIVGVRLIPEDIEKLDRLANQFATSRCDTLQMMIRITFELLIHEVDPKPAQVVNHESGL